MRIPNIFALQALLKSYVGAVVLFCLLVYFNFCYFVSCLLAFNLKSCKRAICKTATAAKSLKSVTTALFQFALILQLSK